MNLPGIPLGEHNVVILLTMAPVEKIKLNEWEEIHEFQIDGWVYRGQPNANDLLKTSLERARYSKVKRAVYLEKKLLREFKRRYHQYADHIPENKDYLEWLSIWKKIEDREKSSFQKKCEITLWTK